MESNTSKKELEILAHNITWLRKYYGISKKKMTELLGIGLKSLNRIERGEIPPGLSVKILYAVHKHFGVCPSAQLSQWLEDETRA